MEAFVNKVQESGLITLDLTQFYPIEPVVLFDIKPHLFMELILKEKEFRATLLTIDWNQYQDKVVGIYCSTDAIIPMWANMLVASSLQPFAKAVYFGNEEQVRTQILLEQINQIDIHQYNEQRVVVKGCGEIPVGESAYVAITQRLRPVVKSIMYGEPCSTVPVYKKK